MWCGVHKSFDPNQEDKKEKGQGISGTSCENNWEKLGNREKLGKMANIKGTRNWSGIYPIT